MQVIEKLEAELESARGARRIDLLVELSVYLTKTDPGRGVELADEALALARRSRDELRTGRALQARALTGLDSGGSLDVVRRLLGARRIFENCRSVPDLADIHRNLLLAYAVLGNIEEAREALTEARRLQNQIDDVEAQAKLENNAGILEGTCGAFDAARECFLRAKDIGEVEGIDTVVQSAWNNMGLLEFSVPQPMEALACFEQALAASRRLGTTRGVAAALINGGRCLVKLERTKEAREWLREGLALAEDLSVRSFARSAHGMLSTLAENEGRLAEALHHRGEFARIAMETLTEWADASVPRSKAEDDALRAEERFRAAQRMEVLARVAGGAAHDFNNVLTALIGHVYLARNAKDEEARERALANIEEASQRGQDLTRRLLSFARLPEGGGKSTNLNETVSGVESLFRPMMPLDLQIWLDLDPDVPLLAIEPARVEQVILNLAINARDAMPGGGILDIRTEARESEVLLTVRDSGSGMDEETAARIFEPFFTTKGEEMGTGLGLYTVRDIVEAAGGTVHVDTGAGIGTTFTLTFPVPERGVTDEG